MLIGNKDTDIIILLNLPDEDIVKVCQVNKYAKSICDDQSFWYRLIKTRFPYIPDEILVEHTGNRKWSDYYKDDLRLVDKNPSINLDESARNGRLDHVMIAVHKQILTTEINRVLAASALYGQFDIVKYLVDNVSGLDLGFALTMTADNGDLTIVKYLVEKGADVNNRNGLPLDFAREAKHQNIVDYLISQGAN